MSMTNIFKKLFIKNYKDTDNPIVRASYGVAAGILGIIANAFLFAIKLLAGILSGSIAVIADAINNLSDFMTSIITAVGFKMSGRPADKEHPFGHERIEYITSLIIACVIFFIGIETGRAGLDKILNASPTDFSIITCIILGASITVKFILAIIFNGLGKSINSDSLKAMCTDSRNDVISTSVVLICAIVAMVTGLSLDGYLGIAVSLLVIYSAINLIKETINPLIGTPPDKDLVSKLETKLKTYEQVLDIHDLIVHSYGPTKTFASVHIEVDSAVDIMLSHDLTDNIEREIYKEMNVLLVCHLDPVNLNDPETETLKTQIIKVIKDFDEQLSLHDFRIVSGRTHTNVIFDVVLPFNLHGKEEQIRTAVCSKLDCFDKKYYAVIEFDTDFNR
ncbi:MAG: cation transporter [Clostridia bacterium]|nr:cation transporter [Clostridia bacterium]